MPDEDSEDTLSRLPVEDVGDPEVLARLKQQEREEREEIERELKAHAQSQSHHQPPSPRKSPREHGVTPSANPMVPPAFSLPLSFPFHHPTSAFMPPISSANSAPPPIVAATHTFPPPPAAAAAAVAALQNSINAGSPRSSESPSPSQQQQTWSFEEQFKQVRQG
ncbi:hypothetical protein L798_02231 [Zootermopsis nevadensis]|uniref:Uncharacterized protein n=1 Tax=Zootermopsis nevadensis TaxID=136037 RepID=A0A067RFI0_ZOONE|nr:hypothetical protein L798_02231 [Zootermopsis nevadensis]